MIAACSHIQQTGSCNRVWTRDLFLSLAGQGIIPMNVTGHQPKDLGCFKVVGHCLGKFLSRLFYNFLHYFCTKKKS